MLTRQSISNSEPEELFGTLLEGQYLSTEELEQSINTTLDSKPDDESMWVFAYGSLMWNPMIDFEESQQGYLPDWERSFCIKLEVGRGSPKQPGRMLALIPGQGTTGMVFKLKESNQRQELSLLWQREMCTDCYQPKWKQIHLTNGNTVNALVFIISHSHPSYLPSEKTSATSDSIASAVGPVGSNVDYLMNLYNYLINNKIHDQYIKHIYQLVSFRITQLTNEKHL